MRDKKLASTFRRMPCRVCFSRAGVTGHHILTVGAQPQLKNVSENIMPLCFDHHRQVHDIGLSKFVEKYSLQIELNTRGFDYCDFNKKWFLPQH